MSLNIYENEGVFELHGKVSSYNAEQVKKYFEIMLKMKSRVIINLSLLDQMDVSGVYAFYELLLHATAEGKYLTFKGANNPSLQVAFLNSGCNLFEFNYFQLSA